MHLMAFRTIKYIEQYVLYMVKLERFISFCYLGLYHGSMSIMGKVRNTVSKKKSITFALYRVGLCSFPRALSYLRRVSPQLQPGGTDRQGMHLPFP